MSTADSSTLSRAIAAALADALTAAAATGADARAWTAARDAAQILSLDGLDLALVACAPHAGRPFPAEVAALAGRLQRLADLCREAGDIAVVRDADPELASLAQEVTGLEWQAAGPEGAARAAVATLGVAEVLEEVMLAGADSREVAHRSRLTVAVAAALRAALDWLTPSHVASPSVRLHAEPSLLELRLERVTLERLIPAHRVLAAVGGVLGRVPDAPGETSGWLIRVPTYSERPTYLLLVQGGIRIAVPWHAVLRLRIVPASDISSGIRRLGAPLLEYVATPSATALEYPVVLIGNGLKRAWLLADRLVWRMVADACVNEWVTPGGGLQETVRAEEGEVFWLADPGRLLAGLELPDLEARPVTEHESVTVRGVAPAPPSEPEVPVLTEADVEPLFEPHELALAAAPVAGAGAAVATAEALAPVEEPVPAEAREPAPSAAIAPATEAPAAAVRVAPPIARPRALVATDSITARLFLTRLLEKIGLDAESVSGAADLVRRLGEPWSVVLVDAAFPDAYGADWLRSVLERARSSGSAHVVALVRDRDDLEAARAASVTETLLKPFGRDEVAALLGRLGLIHER